MRWPFSRISPVVGVSKPATRRSVVVLPQPEGPSKEKKDPRGIAKDTRSTAVCRVESFEESREKSLDMLASSRTASICGGERRALRHMI